MGYFSGVVRLPGTVTPPGTKLSYLSSRQATPGVVAAKSASSVSRFMRKTPSAPLRLLSPCDPLRWAHMGPPGSCPARGSYLSSRQATPGVVAAKSASSVSRFMRKTPSAPLRLLSPCDPLRWAHMGPPGSCPARGSYLSSRQATPGSSLPSMNSRLAPPPVEMWVILSA